MEFYTRKQINENLFEVIGPNEEIIKNHNGKPYPPLSENISQNLINDLNDICRKYYSSDVQSEEDVYNNVLAKISGEELRESFIYCVLSSLMEYEANDVTTELEFEDQLQWDRLFRLNIPPNGGDLELEKTINAREYFGDKWKNFGLNYSQSYEEMDENNVKYVSKEIIEEIQTLANSMHISKVVAVNILYNFFKYFSISIPILWANGKINDNDFISSFYVIHYGVDIENIPAEEKDEPRFLMNRLLYLKTLLWGYDWKDNTLPCVNY